MKEAAQLALFCIENMNLSTKEQITLINERLVDYALLIDKLNARIEELEAEVNHE